MSKSDAPVEIPLGQILAQIDTDFQADNHAAVRKACFAVLVREPKNVQAMYYLGMLASSAGESDEAIVWLREAITAAPKDPAAYNSLGSVYVEVGNYDEAIAVLDAALEVSPGNPHILANKSNALAQQGLADEAEAALRQAVDIAPQFTPLRYNLANLLTNQRRLGDAITEYERVVAAQPDLAAACLNFGYALEAQGRCVEALGQYRIARELSPENRAAYSNCLVASHYDPGTSAEDVAEFGRQWNQRFVRPLPRRMISRDKDAARRLRLGYLSPNLRTHPMGFFIERVLQSHNKQDFEIFCYFDSSRADATTDRFKGFADHWRQVESMNEEQVCQTIEDDQIDILVDLSRHTSSNRLGVFARKPAPIQVTWADGPVCTSGLETMDYLIGDRFHCPDGCDVHYSETIHRLPDDYICFEPPIAAPEVTSPPCNVNGYVTFGSFNKLSKINPHTIETWSSVMRAVEGSRLLLQAMCLEDAPTRDRFAALFASSGISRERIEFHGTCPRTELLERYGQVDVVLDTFPYSGGITTLESIWMGVPVIARKTDYAAANHSVSHLVNMGFKEFVAGSTDHFISLGRHVAEDVDRLNELRPRMREQMAASPVCNGGEFTLHLESAFRQMWVHRCVIDSNGEPPRRRGGMRDIGGK